MYKPKPIDLSGIFLSDELEELIELMAENNHEIWASNRMQEGWTYGTLRNDETKNHPCLIPYNQLPESEKEYDRKMARETLKIILFLGFRIIKD